MSRVRRHREPRDSGLTLIELVVAMSIFALVAVMGLQSLNISLTLRDRLSTSAAQTGDLGRGLALLRNDLSAALPMVFFPPGQARPASALREMRGAQGFSLSLGGQPGLRLAQGRVDASPRQRVDWRFDPSAQRLTRTAWPTLYPVSDTQQGPEVPVLDGVTGMSLRSFWVGHGWVGGLRPPGGLGSVSSAGAEGSGDKDSASSAPEFYSSALPTAVEITLQTAPYGEIVLLEYLQ
ncbi:prepilin-type N-terminal cleavage/methylation domain-containing protein (plasmid) [Roseovarius faecimaris]|uniref:Type II secretion system protein J n=1 Tax=Roseovarius faecimaris TaxID=2494550 RepID=A0A6I6IL54_9RHOB|nr:type II secretion system protein GspJ [Roseovarius faecimaris]QGX96794.1 prepilin-type N-terminal cleavage/methylation domain-containing protein [Roseovarius faecimaris]